MMKKIRHSEKIIYEVFGEFQRQMPNCKKLETKVLATNTEKNQ